MRKRIQIAGIALIALTCAAQSVAPEIILYARIRTHTLDQQAHLPDYTCLETISRFRRASVHDTLKPLDVVRLEVIYSNGKEWFGSPGGKAMDNSDPVHFVGSGLMGSGVFATALRNILNNAQYVSRGEESRSGHEAVRYDVTFRPQPPAFGINMRGGSANVGEKGSLWADRNSFDLLRLELHATDIPRYLPLAAQDTSVNYMPVRIGGANSLLPEDADMSLVDTNGVEDFDHMDFTHCRAYSAESTISFDSAPVPDAAPDTAGAASSAANVRRASKKDALDTSPNLPALLKVTIALKTPVSDTDAVGSLIEGKVVGAVAYRGKIEIPDGATVHGRIRRLEHSVELGKDFIVGLEFTDVERGGAPLRFYADLISIERSPELQIEQKKNLTVGVDGIMTITLPELPGVASFFVAGKTFRLPEGFETVWRTRGPIRGIDQVQDAAAPRNGAAPDEPRREPPPQLPLNAQQPGRPQQ